MKTKTLLLVTLATLGLTTSTMAQNLPNYVPSNGLVGWWPFNGNANDESFNGSNGTVNGTTLTSDRFDNANSAYSFDGFSNQINVQHNNLFNSFPISISVWCKGQSNMGGIVNKYVGCSNNGWSIHSSNNKISGYYYDFPGGSSVNFDPNNNTININDNIWHHVVETYDSLAGKIFIDGNLISTVLFTSGVAPSNCSTTTDLYFGYRVPGNPAICTNYNYFYQGIIDDIGIWNRELTQQEITDLYNGNAGVTGFNSLTHNNTIKIFPNPANNHITIDYGNFATMNGYQLKIENSLGQQLFQTNITQQTDYLILNNWGGNGLYFVHIIDAQGNTIDIRKIVLQ